MAFDVAEGSAADSKSSSCDEIAMHVVIPLPECPHLEQVQDVPVNGIDASVVCSSCHTDQEVWICLSCYDANCSRYVMGHATSHWDQSGHPMVLSLTDLSVWCYSCEAYVHNERLLPAKNSAHLSKFGSAIPSATPNVVE